MPTGATDLGFDVVAQQPRTELNYRVFVDTSGTEASLASIHAEQQVGGGGRLAFSTDSVDGPLIQRMLIDHGGNVGIGTENPGAKLDVAGDANFTGILKVQGALAINGFAEIEGDLSIAAALVAGRFTGNGAGKFNGPLDVQGTLTVSGAGKIDGDLSVIGKLTAASLAGDGTGLSNVTPADNSVSSTKLALDAASLSKVTGGKIVMSADRLDVTGHTTLHGGINVLGGLTAGAGIPNPISQVYGNLHVQGRLTAGVKTFRIDHPLDPENKYLSHSSVESPDVMNIYNGNVITDTEGNATVVLPDYFEALNRDFRYQLTVIGKFAQAAVAGEIKNNRFSVKTDQPNVKVSWQVTGIRNDALANAHFLTVEEEKPESQRGLFLNPEHYGQPKSKGIAFVHSLATEEPITGQANQISAS
jgi:hypothetical protein